MPCTIDHAEVIKAARIIRHLSIIRTAIERNFRHINSAMRIDYRTLLSMPEYINKVDSFIIVSSDSDYWGLISSLPDARFLMMIEHEKSGPDLKAALVNTDIFYCYIDDFYSGNADELKFGALIKEMYRYIDSAVHLNVNEMFSAALKATRIEMSDAEKKQFMAQHIGKVRRKNTGEAPMYYVQNSHVGIISRELFHKTQEELARRMSREPNSTKTATTATGKYSRYALSNVMICAECGSRYKRVTWTSRGKKRVVWRCISRLDYGKRYCKTSLTVDETALHAAIVRVINRFNEEDESTYMALMRATIGEAIGLTGGTDEIDLLRRKIDGLNRKMVSLINESVESGEGIESHEAEFKELSDTIELLQGRIQKLEEALASDQVNDSRILQLQQIIADRASKKMEYDDTIVHQMIECVKVYPDGRLDIIFGGGYLIEERLEKES